MAQEDFDEIAETFEFLDDWEARYRHVIELGRALAPIEMAVGQWSLVQSASRAWNNLARLLTDVPPRRPVGTRSVA